MDCYLLPRGVLVQCMDINRNQFLRTTMTRGSEANASCEAQINHTNPGNARGVVAPWLGTGIDTGCF